MSKRNYYLYDTTNEHILLDKSQDYDTLYNKASTLHEHGGQFKIQRRKTNYPQYNDIVASFL